jgi:hypothetical protein
MLESDPDEESVWPREHVISRVVAILVGLFFIGGVPASLLIHPKLRADVLASHSRLSSLIVAALACAAVGLFFLRIGVTGFAPRWFRRHADRGGRLPPE